MNHYENAFIQHSLGVLPHAGWEGIERDCIEQLEKPSVAKLWASISHLFSSDFCAYLEYKGIKQESKIISQPASDDLCKKDKQ